MDLRTAQGVTTILGDLNRGDDGAFIRLIERVYDDLRAIAANRMRRHYGDGLDALTLQPTALANDAVMELMRQRQQWRDSGQFFAVATLLMVRLLTDYHRARSARKRGGDHARGPAGLSSLAGPQPTDPDHADDAPLVLDAIRRLHDRDPRKAEVVTLHLFCDLPLPRAAEMIGVSRATAERDWRFAKAWVTRELQDARGPDAA